MRKKFLRIYLEMQKALKDIYLIEEGLEDEINSLPLTEDSRNIFNHLLFHCKSAEGHIKQALGDMG